jgi:hypothetical protein
MSQGALFRAALLAISAYLILGLAPPSKAGAEDPCVEDLEGDRCVARKAARLREIYGVQPIEVHQANADQMRRAYFVDGYGRDTVAITFVRTPGREPTAWVHFPRERGKAAAEPLQAAVSKAVWEHVLERSRLFDRKLVPLPDVLEDGSVMLCLHPWNYMVEAVDPPEPNTSAKDRPARRKIGNACHDELVQDYAKELERTAIPLFPACAALEPAQHRNDASRLAACGMLRGDKLAAAEVLNSAGEFREPRDPEDAPALARLFSNGASISWEGAAMRAPDPGKAWLAGLKSSRAHYFYAERVDGLSSRRVRLLGKLVRRRQGINDGSLERAPVEQNWVYIADGYYQLESVKVGSFAQTP